MCALNGNVSSFYIVKMTKGNFSDCFFVVEFPIQDIKIPS